MRYNPATDNAIHNERMQAKLSLIKVQPEACATPARVNWAKLEADELRWARDGGVFSHRLINCASLSHGIEVAEALGNWCEARRLRAQLIAGLY